MLYLKTKFLTEFRRAGFRRSSETFALSQAKPTFSRRHFMARWRYDKFHIQGLMRLLLVTGPKAVIVASLRKSRSLAFSRKVPNLISNFKKIEINPLTELTELRMELSESEEELELHCQMRFATAEVEFSNRSYYVGINQARLQLYLEGWEKVLGKDLGDNTIPTVEKSSELVRETNAGGQVDVALNSTGSMKSGIAGNAGSGMKRVDTASFSTSLQPVTPQPGNAWKVEANSVDGSRPKPLEGTALSGERLCSLKKQSGSNRSTVSAELQVRRNKISVEPATGNKWGKRFSLLRNKDAIVAKVLQNALSRETELATNRSLEFYVVASKVEFEQI